MEVEDLRSAERYVVADPIPGSYGATGIAIVNVSSVGAQIAHSQPLRLGTKARLTFKQGDQNVTTQGLIIWSRFAKPAEDKSDLRYRSGVRIETDDDGFAAAVQTLVQHGVAQPDVESLERKRRRLQDRNADKTSRLVIKGLKPESQIPADQALLIQHARERLRAHPEEALKWYNRAKYAMTEIGSQVNDAIPNREEVLAVWEYLERSVDIPTIVSVFEKLRRS